MRSRGVGRFASVPLPPFFRHLYCVSLLHRQTKTKVATKLLLPQTRFLQNPLRKNPCTSSPPQSYTTLLTNHRLLYTFAPSFDVSAFPSNLCLKASRTRRNWFVTSCVNRTQELIDDDRETSLENEDHVEENSREQEGEEEIVGKIEKQELADQSIWGQMKEIIKFTGPATGLWICGPLMSLIDTAVIGQGSSIELAALGPATVVCDYMSYVFVFLVIATSNMVATALAKQDREEVQHHIYVLLFVGLACGFVMLLFTRLFGAATLTAFSGSKNLHVVPAANTYVQVVLKFLVTLAKFHGMDEIFTRVISLGIKDSWGPLKALAAASVINGVGDMVLCIFLGYGIAGAAWATVASQVVAAYMMIQTLNEKGYNAFAFSVPSVQEIWTILGLAAPVFVTMMSKVAFYSLLIYSSTSMGTHTMAAHQVMVQSFCMCTARILLKSLVIIGATLGLLLGIVGTSVPWLFPNIFTPDQMVIQEMHKVMIPYFIALVVIPPTHSLEGTLLAGRDLRFICLPMSGCFTLGALVLLILSGRYGLQGCCFALAGFQWARFSIALQRLLSPNGMLYSEESGQYKQQS